MRIFFDTEHEIFITEKELRSDFDSAKRDDCSFSQFVENCLTRNSGTLEEIQNPPPYLLARLHLIEMLNSQNGKE